MRKVFCETQTYPSHVDGEGLAKTGGRKKELTDIIDCSVMILMVRLTWTILSVTGWYK